MAPIKGYRDLSERELQLINDIKDVANIIGQMFDDGHSLVAVADSRWLAIAKTDLQKGFMALIRAVAKPGGF